MRVSLYPGASPPAAALERAAARARESGVKLRVARYEEFRTSLVTTPHPADWTTRMIFRTCRMAGHCLMLYEGRLYKCACPPFLPDYLAKLGRAGYDPAVDALDIHAAPDLLAALGRFLASREPLEACRHCLGSVGKMRPHRQLSRAEATDPRLVPITRARDLARAKLARESLRYLRRRALEWWSGRPRG